MVNVTQIAATPVSLTWEVGLLGVPSNVSITNWTTNTCFDCPPAAVVTPSASFDPPTITVTGLASSTIYTLEVGYVNNTIDADTMPENATGCTYPEVISRLTEISSVGAIKIAWSAPTVFPEAYELYIGSYHADNISSPGPNTTLEYEFTTVDGTNLVDQEESYQCKVKAVDLTPPCTGEYEVAIKCGYSMPLGFNWITLTLFLLAGFAPVSDVMN